MSKYIRENSENSPSEATAKRLCAGAAAIHIEHSNGAIEVTNSSGALLMQAKNVREGTWSEIWRILGNCGETEFRAGGK